MPAQCAGVIQQPTMLRLPAGNAIKAGPQSTDHSRCRLWTFTALRGL